MQNLAKKEQFLTILIIALGSLFIRFCGISDFEFNQDEAWHLMIASQQNLLELINYNFNQEVHPPLSPIIWHFMLKISANEIWLRSATIIAGVALIPSIYILGNILIGRFGALTMAIICAFGLAPTIVSQTIRAYSMLMLALAWMAILMLKIIQQNDWQSNKKALLQYFALGLIAVELHHSAALLIFTFGTILFAFSIPSIRKNGVSKFVYWLLSIHAILALLVISYSPILKNFYNFGGNYGYFLIGGIDDYLYGFVKFIISFVFGFDYNQFNSPFILLVLLVAPIALFRAKKWLILTLILLPFLTLCLADYLLLYPFAEGYRNNMFLFLSPLLLSGYLIQITAQKIAGKFPQFLRLESFFGVVLTLIFVTIYVKNDFFRTSDGVGCIEFNLSKKEFDLLEQKLAEKKSPSNVFVTINQKIWDLQYRNLGQFKITFLTKNLAKFESEKITAYFTAFPGRERDTTISLVDHQLFLADLFNHLKATGEFDKIKTITFFDYGLANDFLTTSFDPQFINLKFSTVIDDDFRVDLRRFLDESEEFSWAIHQSKEVTEKFNFKGCKKICGREILVLSFTPKFVFEQILGRDFIDFRAVAQDRVLGRYQED